MSEKREYIRNILTVFSGTATAQIIPILLSPVLSRLYSPEDFGVYAMAMSIGLCGAAVAASQYNHGIMLEQKDENVKNVIMVSTLTTALISMLVFLFLIVAVFGAEFLSLQKIRSVCIILPLYILFSGFISAFSFWNNRYKRYGVISKGRVVASTSTAIIQIGIAIIFGGKALFLLLGFVLGQFLSFLYLLHSSRDLYKDFYIKQALSKVKQVGSKYKKFLIFTSFSDLLNTLLMQLPVFILTKQAGAGPTGQFSFSNRLLAVPISFVSSSVGEVFKQRAVEEYKTTGSSIKSFTQTFKGLFLLSLVPFTLLFIFAPELFSFVFGEEWREAGEFTRIMIPMFFFKFTVSPLTYIYYINGRQKEDFILHIIMLILVVTSLYLGYEWFKSTNMALLCYSLCFSCIYLYYLYRSYVLSKNIQKASLGG